MPYTQADLDAVREAIRTGARRVSYAGKETEFRTLADLRTIEKIIEAEVNPPTSTAGSPYVRRYRRGETGW